MIKQRPRPENVEMGGSEVLRNNSEDINGSSEHAGHPAYESTPPEDFMQHGEAEPRVIKRKEGIPKKTIKVNVSAESIAKIYLQTEEGRKAMADIEKKMQGIREPEIVLIRRRTGEKYRIPVENCIVIGSSFEQADTVIAGNSAISRTHASLDTRGGRIAVRDNNSTNGTFVKTVRGSGINRVAAGNEPVLVQNGDVIVLADEEFEIQC